MEVTEQKRERTSYYSAEKYLAEHPVNINKITVFNQYQHAHNYVQIWYVQSGTCLSYIGDEKHSIKKGDIIIVPVNVPHRLDSQSCPNLIMVGCEFSDSMIFDGTRLPFDCLKELIIRGDQNKPVYSVAGNDLKNIEELFKEMVFERGHKKIGFEFQLKANILKILTILARNCRETGSCKTTRRSRHQETILKAIDYIDLNYRKKITLNDVCKVTAMSATCFAGMFKEVTGRTFTEYVNHLRIQNAIELLHDDKFTLKEISVEIGFKDPAYFSRIFTKYKGVSPKEFRKTMINFLYE